MVATIGQSNAPLNNMIIDELNKKISDIENLANDKAGSLESKVNDLTDGILMVADAVDIIPEMVDEKITAITKEFSTIKDAVSKVKAKKGDKGDRGEPGIDGIGIKGDKGDNGSPDTGEQIASKLNELEGVIDTKVLKDFSLPDVGNLQKQIDTIGNQTLRLLSRPTTTSTGSSFTGVSVDGISITGDGLNTPLTANFTQTGKYMISGGITWSGTGLTYDVSFLQYFFNGNKTANPTQVTLDASDPTNNRFDAIVVDESGTVTAITGTASANPEVPAIPEEQLQVTIILVAAGSTTPTISSEEIYMDDPTTGWTTSTYDAASPATGTINFSGTNSPKQGINDIEASTDLRKGARFVRGTSFDAYQYTMLQVWVRFTGTAVATNKSLNVRFENSAGTLVGSTVNLFNYGLQRGVLNTWQLVVVPITAFGALPATVKGLKVIMAGGTVGVVRQWDLDYMILTNGSVPYANVPTIAFSKNGTGIASQSGVNLIEGTGVTITGVNDPTNGRVNYTLSAGGVEQVKVSLTPKQFTSAILNNTPYSLIASPGSGKYINVLNIDLRLTYGTTDYTLGATELGFGTNTSATNFKHILGTIINNTTSFIENLNTQSWQTTGNPDVYIPISENSPLYMIPNGANITLTGRNFQYSLATTAFVIGETVTGDVSGNTGIVWFDNGTILGIDSPSGAFSGDTTITGGTSGCTATIDKNNFGGDSNIDLYITYKVVTL